MIPVSHNYQLAAQEGRPQMLLSVWTTKRGRYLWGTVFPSPAMVAFFGSVNFWDGVGQTLGDGQTWGGIPVCEYDQRILNASDIHVTLVPTRGRLLVSLGQTERATVTLEYDNSDGYFSRLWGDQRNEPFLGQRHEIYHGFLGLAPGDFVKLLTAEIVQRRYDDRKAIVISNQQVSVYPVIEYAPTLTAYALTNPYVDANTLVLIHSDGPDGGSTFVDSSDYGNTVTVNGTVTHEDTQAKFGTTSIDTAGADTDYLSTPGEDFGTGDFTIDFWLWLTSAAGNRGIFQTNWNPGVWIYLEPGTTDTLYVKIGTSGSFTLLSAVGSGAYFDAWMHVAVVRASGTATLYINGVAIDSDPSTQNLTGGGSTVKIGATSGVGGNGLVGFIDEFRLSDVARWTAAFTPPPSPYGNPLAILAQGTFTHAALATVFFASDNWTCTINFDKDELGSAGALFQLLNDGTETTLEIGIDASNYAYVTTGQDVEGTPATTTYTDTLALTASMIANHLNLFVRYNHTDSEITFSVNGSSRTQAAAVPYDRTGTNDEQVIIGSGFEGRVLSVKFGNTFFAVNNQGSDLLATIPDVVGGHDLTVTDGYWEAW